MNKLPTAASQNWRKNRQKGLTNKKILYVFFSDVNVFYFNKFEELAITRVKAIEPFPVEGFKIAVL